MVSLPGEIEVVSEAGMGTTVKVSLLVDFAPSSPHTIPLSNASDLSIPPLRTFTRKQISEKYKQGRFGRRLSDISTPSTPTVATPPRRPTLPEPLSLAEDRNVLPISSTTALKTNIPSSVSTEQQGNGDVRVLVVDDNQIGRKILTTLLSRKGVPFEEAVNGLQALSVFRRFRPQVVWTYVCPAFGGSAGLSDAFFGYCRDVSMPVMDGVESARQMRVIEKELDLPPAWIVAITGLSSQNEMVSIGLS